MLEFDADLVRRIDAEQLLEHDSPEEVEIRACALHAVELLVHAHPRHDGDRLDNMLWQRGAAPRYKTHPRHRARRPRTRWRSSRSRASTRSSTRCASAPRSSMSAGDPDEGARLAAELAPDLTCRRSGASPASSSRAPAGRTSTSPRRCCVPARSSTSRGRGGWATSAPRSASRPPPMPRPCSPAATAIRGTPWRSAGPPACSSRCRSRAWTRTRPRPAAGRDRPRRRRAPVPAHAILAFGSERRAQRRAARTADARIRIPMRAGVSSLNLATAVAAVLYRSMHS